jgi:DNA-binding transcriptional LysR family regulator
MKLDDMELFILVAELGSFTKTADYKNMPKSTVSRRVKDLEDSLKIRLLDRTTRTLKLTQQGELFYQRAKIILDDIAKFQHDIADEQITAAGVITVYAPSVMFYLFADWILEFRNQFPDIQLELLNLDSTTRFPEGTRFDLILQPGVVEDSSYIVRKITDVPGQYYASPTYLKKMGAPLNPKELPQHNIIFHSLYHGESTSWKFDDGNDPYLVDFTPQVVTNSPEAVLCLALAGAGVVRLPIMLSKPYVERGELCELFMGKYTFTAPMYVLYPSRRYMPERVRLLLQFLLDNVPKAIGELS